MNKNLWFKISAGKTPSTTMINKELWEYFKPGDSILEVGCGNGRIIFDCKKRGLIVTGIDINKNEIKKLKEKFRNKHDKDRIKYGNILSIKFKKTFDGAIVAGLLSTLEKKNRDKCVKRINKFLKPNGYLYVSEFKLDNKFAERYKKDFLITKEYGTLSVKDEDGKELYRSHNFTKKEITDLIQDNGFKIINFKNATFVSYHGHKKPGIMIIAIKK